MAEYDENNVGAQEESSVEDQQIKGIFIDKRKIQIVLILFVLFVFLVFQLKPSRSSDKEESVSYEEVVSDTGEIDLPDEYTEEQPRDAVVPEIVVQEVNSVGSTSIQIDEEEIRRQERLRMLREQKLAKLRQEAELSRRSRLSINFQKPNDNKDEVEIANSPNLQYPSLDALSNNPSQQYLDQNRQDEKNEFLKNREFQGNYLSTGLSKPLSTYEVKSSSIIPAILITEANSDLPSYLSAQVREDVYDTVTGNHLLIPKGTRLIGQYDSSVTFGQERLLVVWQRMILPNGESLNLENMGGVDLSGAAGFKDKVDTHFGTLLKGVLLSAILGGTTAYITEENDNNDTDDDNDFLTQAGAAAGLSAIEIGNKWADKALERQPTLVIRKGYRFNIFVHKDMILKPYEE